MDYFHNVNIVQKQYRAMASRVQPGETVTRDYLHRFVYRNLRIHVFRPSQSLHCTSHFKPTFTFIIIISVVLCHFPSLNHLYEGHCGPLTCLGITSQP